jgi:hypothetical protein
MRGWRGSDNAEGGVNRDSGMDGMLGMTRDAGMRGAGL